MVLIPKSIDELFNDPSFLGSEEYRCIAEVAVALGKTPMQTFLYLNQAFEDDSAESRALWEPEVKAAIAAEKQNQIFTPMKRIAECISDCVKRGDFSSIPDEHWLMLADFLAGTHRGHKGQRPEAIQDFNRQSDLDILSLYDSLLNRGMSSTQAVEKLAQSQHMDARSIRRVIKRAKQYKSAIGFGEYLSKIDMTKFFRGDS